MPDPPQPSGNHLIQPKISLDLPPPFTTFVNNTVSQVFEGTALAIMKKLPCILASIILSTGVANPCLAAGNSPLSGNVTPGDSATTQSSATPPSSTGAEAPIPASADDLGVWTTGHMVDKFGMPTEETVVSLQNIPVKTDSATKRNYVDLQVQYGTDGYMVSFGSFGKLLENCTVSMRDSYHLDREFEGVPGMQKSRYYLSPTDSKAVVNALITGGPVTFLIEENNGDSSLFTVEETVGAQSAMDYLRGAAGLDNVMVLDGLVFQMPEDAEWNEDYDDICWKTQNHELTIYIWDAYSSGGIGSFFYDDEESQLLFGPETFTNSYGIESEVALWEDEYSLQAVVVTKTPEDGYRYSNFYGSDTLTEEAFIDLVNTYFLSIRPA